MDIETDSPTRAHTPVPRVCAAHAHGLAVIGGPASGLRRLIDEEEIRIGKASSNHLCLPDPTVSRFHCVVERTGRGLLLRDLGSVNGTRVGGCWVESAYLSPEIPIQIGTSVVQVFRADGEATPTTPPGGSGPRLLGHSEAMRKLMALIPRLTMAEAPILLEGETGTGKSFIAEQIHRASPRAGGPFVVLDCGALAPTLIESELFGHERGAFTGAGERRIGAFESAQGGTLFLDEIGELPLELQPRLLRALEDRTIRRVGSLHPVRLDLQIVAATNRDLERAVARGQFRADLYYRLNAFRFTVPPLRDRPEDIPELVSHFCRRTRAEIPSGLADRLTASFVARSWPGNVRELRNAVERAVLLGACGSDDATAIGAPAPPPCDDGFATPFRIMKERAINRWEQSYLTDLLRHVRGNISAAARLAQVDRGHLRDLLRRHEIAARTDE